MRELDRRQHLQHQLQTRAQRALIVVAILRERLARYVLQREVRLTVRGNSRIQQARDQRMLQRSEDIALAREALARAWIDSVIAQQLQRDLAREQTIGAFGEPHA